MQAFGPAAASIRQKFDKAHISAIVTPFLHHRIGIQCESLQGPVATAYNL